MRKRRIYSMSGIRTERSTPVSSRANSRVQSSVPEEVVVLSIDLGTNNSIMAVQVLGSTVHFISLTQLCRKAPSDMKHRG